MKIEISPLDAKGLLLLLTDAAVKKIAIAHFAVGALDNLIAELKKATK